MTEPHPWRRYVALGDSFTEGIGDPEPGSPTGHRGWADRVAEVLADQVEGFSYANLAIRGRLLAQIADEQVEPAMALHPDLVSLSAGGNDILRPGADPDRLADRLDRMVERLSSEGATVILFTGTDVKFSPVFGRLRGKVAIYNEDIRAIAARRDCIVADQWALTEIQDPRRSATTRSRAWCCRRSPSRTTCSRSDPSRSRRAPGARPARATSTGRAPTSCRGCCGASATSPPATGARPRGPTRRRGRARTPRADPGIDRPGVPGVPGGQPSSSPGFARRHQPSGPGIARSSASGTRTVAPPAVTVAVPTSAPASPSAVADASTVVVTGVSAQTSSDRSAVLTACAVAPHAVV
jgi:hypothetical protein